MKTREVTKKDVADAAMIAQLIGGADVTDAGFTCVEQEPRKLHDCPDCEHYEHVDECEHQHEWECIPAAIGASPEALDLWMDVSNAFFTTAEDREAELHYFRTEERKRELRAREQLYAWVDSIREGGIDHGDIGLNELEVAELLRDGHLPPGWKIVAKTRKLQPVPKKRLGRRESAPRGRLLRQVEISGLPMVRINMTALGPQVES